MRAWVIGGGLVIACVAGAARDEIKDKVDALPEISTIEHGRAHVIVRGELPRAKQRAATKLAEAVIADVERRFTGARDVHDAPVTLCLMPDDAHFEALARVFGDVPSTMGFYRPDHRVALANLGNSIGNLRHELVHPLIGDDFPEIPTWLNEGIAALYGTATLGNRGFSFEVNYRLRDLQRALEHGELPTIGELAESSEEDVHGARAGVFYAMARYVLLYVDRRGKLSELYGELRDATGDVAKQRTVLERYVDDKAFVAWAKKLRY